MKTLLSRRAIRSRKTQRGISSILGTVIVLAITIALGVLLYGYAHGMFSSLSQNADVNAQASLIVNPSTGQAYLQYSISNQGNLKFNITQILIEGPGLSASGYSISTSITLIPGNSYTNVTALPSTVTIQAGSYYTVIFEGYTSTGKPIQIAQNVLASNTG